MMEGLFAYKVQRSPSGSLRRTKEVEPMSEGLQCPWTHDWVFCSSCTSTAFTGSRLCKRYWIHCGFRTVVGGFWLGFPKSKNTESKCSSRYQLFQFRCC
jgi:hypothetical protein